MVADEYRQIRRLDKLDYLHQELKSTKTEVKAQRDTMRGLKQQSLQNFEQFDKARSSNLADARKDIEDKKGELVSLKEQMDAKMLQN